MSEGPTVTLSTTEQLDLEHTSSQSDVDPRSSGTAHDGGGGRKSLRRERLRSSAAPKGVTGPVPIAVRAAPYVVGLVWGITFVVLVLRTAGPLIFDAMIAGQLAYRDDYKNRDMFVLPVGVTLAVLVGAITTWRLNALTGVVRGKVANHLLWWSLPALMMIPAFPQTRAKYGNQVALTGAGDPAASPVHLWVGTLALITSVAATAMILIIGTIARRSRLRPVDEVSTAMGAVLLWIAVPLSLGVILSRMPGEALVGDRTVSWIGVGEVLGAAIFVVLLVSAFTKAWPRVLRFVVTTPQLIVPFLLLALFPAVFETPTGIERLPITRWYLAALAIAALVAIVFVAWPRIRGAARYERLASLSPIAVGITMAMTMFGATVIPYASADDYHRGERFLGWLAYRSGALPYVDYVPAHGMFQDDVPAIWSAVIGDGSLPVQSEAERFFSAVAVICLVIALQRFSGHLGFAVMAVAVMTASQPRVNSAMVLIAVTALWLNPALRRRPGLWVSVWLLSVPLVVLAVPAQGAILVLASGVLVLHALISAVGARDWRSILTGLLVAAGCLAVMAVTVLGPMVRAALEYVMVIAPTNTLAWGKAWNPYFAKPLGAWGTPDPWLDTLRMLWVVALALLLIYAARLARRGRWREQVSTDLVFGILLTLGLIPYMMARIDTTTSRTDRTGLALLIIIVPLVAWRLLSPTRLIAVVTASVLVGSYLYGQPAAPIGVPTMAHRVVPSPALGQGREQGLPGWGLAIPVDPLAHQQNVLLARAVEAELQPEERFFDVTNRNAVSYYLQRPSPVSFSAVLNQPAAQQQTETIERLEEQGIKLALLRRISANVGDQASIRVPLLFDYLQDNFTPYQYGGVTLARRGSEMLPTDGHLRVAVDRHVVDDDWDRGWSRDGLRVKLEEPGSAVVFQPGAQVKVGADVAVVADADSTTQEVLFTAPVSAQERGMVPDLAVPVAQIDPDTYHNWLFEHSLGQWDLMRLPSAWGRSVDHLDITRTEPAASAGSAELTDDGSVWEIPVPTELSGGANSFDLVGFRTICEGSATPYAIPAQLVVSWRSGPEAPFEEGIGRSLEISGPDQLVPLSSSPFWHTAQGVDRLRVRLIEANGCSSVKVSDPVFYRGRM